MLDCYRVIVYPFKKKLTFGQTLLIIASSWIVCYLIVALLLSFSFELLKGFWVDVKCVEKPRSAFVRIWRVVFLILIFCITCMVGFCCVFRIKGTLQENRKYVSQISSHKYNLRRIKNHQKRNIILSVIVISFIICFSPFSILLIVDIAANSSSTYNPQIIILFAFCYMLLLVNYTVNPVILYTESYKGFSVKPFLEFFRLRIKCSLQEPQKV